MKRFCITLVLFVSAIVLFYTFGLGSNYFSQEDLPTEPSIIVPSVDQLPSSLSKSSDRKILKRKDLQSSELAIPDKAEIIDNSFPKAVVVRESKSTSSALGKDHLLVEERLIETNFKYPLVQTIERSGRQVRRLGLASKEVFVADHFIVQLREGMSRTALEKINEKYGTTIRRKLKAPKSYLIQISRPSLGAVKAAIEQYKQEAQVIASAETDQLLHLTEMPNDPLIDRLWGMHNVSQMNNAAGDPIKEDVDIDAPEAWKHATGSRTVTVGVLDTGIDYRHPDLAENMWRNPAEVVGDANNDGCPGVCGVDDNGDGLIDPDSNGCGSNGREIDGSPCEYLGDLAFDDDENGYPDDIFGYDFADNDSDPNDDHYHGTHCAGTIGAVGDNSIGVAGVNWHVSLVALKIFGTSGLATLSDAAEAIFYAGANNIDITSNSWGGFEGSDLLYAAIKAEEERDALFVVAAGNNYLDIDGTLGVYPAGYDLSNIISVAALDPFGKKAAFSNYGTQSVDIGAPGVHILSTFPSEPNEIYQEDADYQAISGTSMATPHVAGALALLQSVNPELSAARQKRLLFASGVPNSDLHAKTVTGRELNLARLIRFNQRKVLTVGVVIDDDSEGESRGNGDGIPNPGERIELRLILKNVADTPVKGVSVQFAFESESSQLDLVKNTLEIQNIEPAAEITTKNAFIFEIAPETSTPLQQKMLFAFAERSFPEWIDEEMLTVYTSSVLTGRVYLDDKGFRNTTVHFDGPTTGQVQTSSSGDFRIPVIDGTYRIWIKPDDFNSSAVTEITAPEPDELLEWFYYTAAQGQIQDFISGEGVADSLIRLSGSHIGTTQADNSGRYSIVLPINEPIDAAIWAAKPGTYFPAKAQKVTSDRPATTIDFELTPGGYSIRMLDITGPFNRATPTDINDAGEVVGFEQIAHDDGTLHFQAAKWDASSGITHLNWPKVGKGHSGAYSIDNSGRIAGHLDDFADTVPFVELPNGAQFALSLPPGRSAGRVAAFSETGGIVGATRYNGSFFASEWNAEGELAFFDFPTSTIKSSFAYGYSRDGDPLGAVVSTLNEVQSVHWKQGRSTQALALPHLQNVAIAAVSASGAAIGTANSTVSSMAEYVLWNAQGEPTVISEFFAENQFIANQANDINNAHEVVATARLRLGEGTEERIGFWSVLWNKEMGPASVRDLAKLESTVDNYYWFRGLAVNNEGEITGFALNEGLWLYGMVLTPNRKMHAQDDSFAIQHGNSLNGRLAATGNLSNKLRFEILQQPGHGRLQLQDSRIGSFSYRAENGFYGTDSFTFLVYEGSLVSRVGTIELVVKAPDSDKDGVPDDTDNCIGFPNPNQSDSNNDSIGDLCAEDRDGDSIPDEFDCAPEDSNRYYSYFYLDEDNDLVRDSEFAERFACRGGEVPSGYTLNQNGPDNCPGTPNGMQEDLDENGVGDSCDNDIDGDGFDNDIDCAQSDAQRMYSLAYPDPDGDGVRNSSIAQSIACSGVNPPAQFTYADGSEDNCPTVANSDQVDSNNNGVGDACEDEVNPHRLRTAPLDFDGDGLTDHISLAASKNRNPGSFLKVWLSGSKTLEEVPVALFKGELLFGDYNGDSLVDVIPSTIGPDKRRYWQMEKDEVQFGKKKDVILSESYFDNDQKLDFATLSRRSVTVRNSSSGTDTQIKLRGIKRRKALRSVFFVRDEQGGQTMIAVVRQRGNRKRGPLHLILHSPDGTVLSKRSLKQARKVYAADIDFDGRDELLLVRRESAMNSVHLILPEGEQFLGSVAKAFRYLPGYFQDSLGNTRAGVRAYGKRGKVETLLYLTATNDYETVNEHFGLKRKDLKRSKILGAGPFAARIRRGAITN